MAKLSLRMLKGGSRLRPLLFAAPRWSIPTVSLIDEWRTPTGNMLQRYAMGNLTGRKGVAYHPALPSCPRPLEIHTWVSAHCKQTARWPLADSLPGRQDVQSRHQKVSA